MAQKNERAPGKAPRDSANIPEWLTVEQVARRFSVSSATIWRWVRERRFPKPVQIGPRSTRWRRVDVDSHETTLTRGAA